jgi:kynurenine formamidase
MKRLLDLTHPLRHGQAAYPGDPSLEITAHLTVPKDGCQVSRVVFSSHHGTHLDAPRHFREKGTPVDQLPLDRFYGPARLVDLAPHSALPPDRWLTVADFAPHADCFQPGARVVYRTGWSSRYGQPDYYGPCPSLTAEAAQWIADRRIHLLGMDTPTPSQDTVRCHEILLGADAEIVIVEGLTNLEHLPAEFILMAFPLRLEGLDGSPIRAVALLDAPP